MKRSFSRDYWFLVGIWLLSGILLPFLLRELAVWISGNPEGALSMFVDKAAAQSVLIKAADVLTAGLRILSSAAYLFLLIRFWILPVLPVYLLQVVSMLIPSAASLFSAFAAGSVRYIWNFLIMALSGIVTFILAKLFLRLTGEREWVVFLILVAFQKIPLAAIQMLAGRDLGAEYLLSIALHTGKDIVLLTVAFGLLYLCVHKWWSGELAAAPADNQ